VWLYIQGSRAAQTTSLPSAETAERKLSGLPVWEPEESIANKMGVDFASRGEYEKAIGHFEIAVEANDSYLPGHKNLLAACVETERWEKARQAAEQAEELHPLSEHLQRARPPENEETTRQLRQESDLTANLGRAYLETGDLALAEDRFTLHLRLRPNELKGYCQASAIRTHLTQNVSHST
jgi:tetratricopeptide (TPR) repeat protein